MSSIAFHTPRNVVRISGRERAWMGSLCTKITIAHLDIPEYPCDVLDVYAWKKMLPEYHYLLDIENDRFGDLLKTWLSVGREFMTLPDGRTIEPFTLGINTAIIQGNDQVCLLARLHAQCEIHCYVEGQDRSWMADIIDDGYEIGMMRTTDGYDGWPAVSALLREHDDDAVVCSYSVGDSFPYSGKTWEESMASLRASDEVCGLRISPESLRRQGFDSGVTAYDINRALDVLTDQL